MKHGFALRTKEIGRTYACRVARAVEHVRSAGVQHDRLRDARLILFDRTSSYYDLTSALFRPAGSFPRGVLELDHIDAAKQMVLAGLGVALLPTTAVAGELRDGSLRRLDLIGTPPIERRIVAVRRLDPDGRSDAAASFWEQLVGFEDPRSSPALGGGGG